METLINFFKTVLEFIPEFIPGVITTLQLAFLSILFGTILGLFIALLKLTNNKIIIGLANAYITLVRGTPLLLQLWFIFYGLPSMGIRIDTFPSAILGLSLHNAAYISEIFRGAIESIDSGQNEAARSLGMTQLQCLRRVVLPQAFRRSIPSLGNQFIIAIKDSSLASVITITETMLTAKQLVSATFNVFPIFFIAAAFYLIMTTVVARLLTGLEDKLRVETD